MAKPFSHAVQFGAETGGAPAKAISTLPDGERETLAAALSDGALVPFVTSDG